MNETGLKTILARVFLNEIINLLKHIIKNPNIIKKNCLRLNIRMKILNEREKFL